VASAESFDLKLYDAGFTTADLGPALPGLIAHLLSAVSSSDSGGWPHCRRTRQQRRALLYHLFWRRAGMSADVAWMEPTQPGDHYADYCQWPYDPLAPTGGKLRQASLLWASLQAAGAHPYVTAACRQLRTVLGPFRAVYGVKLQDGRVELRVLLLRLRPPRPRPVDPQGACRAFALRHLRSAIGRAPSVFHVLARPRHSHSYRQGAARRNRCLRRQPR